MSVTSTPVVRRQMAESMPRKAIPHPPRRCMHKEQVRGCRSEKSDGRTRRSKELEIFHTSTSHRIASLEASVATSDEPNDDDCVYDCEGSCASRDDKLLFIFFLRLLTRSIAAAIARNAIAPHGTTIVLSTSIPLLLSLLLCPFTLFPLLLSLPIPSK